jgi:hypothetical protein
VLAPLATREVYAKSILFDYSYKYFYEDGYGKESLILNLKDEDYTQEDTARQYFTACLLSFLSAAIFVGCEPRQAHRLQY